MTQSKPDQTRNQQPESAGIACPQMWLLAQIDPGGTIRLHPEAIIPLLHRMLEEEIVRIPFLLDCGIELSEQNGIGVTTRPKEGLRVNEEAVGLMLKSLLESRLVKQKLSDSIVLTLSSSPVPEGEINGTFSNCIRGALARLGTSV